MTLLDQLRGAFDASHRPAERCAERRLEIARIADVSARSTSEMPSRP